MFSSVTASVREGKTKPPRTFTEDLLLSAMESASAQDMPEDSEREGQSYTRHGLGTPATRAGIIEKLVKTGLLDRKARQLLPSQKAVNLIAVLPDAVKSPQLTANWEHQLGKIESGELTSADFMSGIAEMTRALIREHSKPNPDCAGLFATTATGEVTGTCPRCASSVRERKKGFFCDSKPCGFALWKDNRFFAAKKKVVDTKIAATLLKEGRIFMSGLYSEKTGKTYDAFVVLEDTGKYVNFKLDFQKQIKGG